MRFPFLDQVGGDGAAAGGGTAGAAGATGAAAGAAGAAGAAQPWYASYDQESQGWLQNRGLDKLPAEQALPELVKGFRAAEKHIGVPADQLVRLPKEGDTAAWETVYSKLGRPADPSKYDLKLPEGTDPKFNEWARSTFHKLGLNNNQANALLSSYYSEYANQHIQAREAEYNAKIEADTAALKKEWGAAEAKNVQIARGAAKELGVPGEAIDALEKVLGYAGTMKLFHQIGAAFGEDKYLSGGQAAFTGAQAPAAAMSRIQQLQADQQFVKRLQSGDVAAKKEWDDLFAQAYPPPAA